MMAARSSRLNNSREAVSRVLEPRSIAVIGASRHREKVGYAVLANLIDSGFPGDIHAVNSSARRVQGIDCYPDVQSLPAPVDLAVIIVPAPAVPDVVQACALKGIEAGAIISAGFREIGSKGRQLEREVVRRARRGGMRLLGPNCLGVINSSLPMNLSFSRLMPPVGSIGVLSQSGAMCTSLLDWAQERNMGFSKMVSLGNGADLDESDFLKALASDEETTVISMYLEGVSNGKRFFKALSAAARRKPVVLLKAGTTNAGARAASSHTGALAGSAGAYNAVCDQARAVRAESVEEFVELSRAFATQNTPRGPRVAVVTNAGGPGIIAADACERAGLKLAALSGDAVERLGSKLPAAASLYNPVDVLGDAGADRYALAIKAVLSDPGVDALVVILTPQAMTDAEGVAHEIVKSRDGTDKTVITCFMGAGSVESAVFLLAEAGIPNVEYPDRALGVISRMYQRTVQMKKRVSKPVKFDVDVPKVRGIFYEALRKEENQVGPEDCREVLAAYGIPFAPFQMAADIEEAEEIAVEFGYPVALKIISPQVLHKTDVGGVRLDIGGPEELEDAYYDIVYGVRRRIPGVEIYGVGVQKMAPEGKELILGMVKDPQFGPMVMAGLGGIYVEAFNDVTFRLAPVPPEEAARMLTELESFSLLKGVRGEDPSDVEAVQEVLMRLSQMVVDHPLICEMDINPLMVYNAGDGCTCVDIRITLEGDRACVR